MKAAIVACSDGQKREYSDQNTELLHFLEKQGMDMVCSKCIYEKQGVFPGTVEERASQLMKMFADDDIDEIYDISGGDIANMILDELDFEVIGKSKARFWGYSDLTTIINAIYTMTGKSSVLYQVKNMVRGSFQAEQRARFMNREELFHPRFEFICGKKIEGIVIGGNVRCFLKLAGTKYFPDLKGKVLLLEALGGDAPQIATCFAQLKQLGVFEKISGILLGTFTHLEANGNDAYDLIKEYAGDLPIARTRDIGHGHDAKAICIGKEISLSF